MAPTADTIDVPLNKSSGGDEVLEVDLNDLEGNQSTIIDILQQEIVPLKMFVQFAV